MLGKRQHDGANFSQGRVLALVQSDPKAKGTAIFAPQTNRRSLLIGLSFGGVWTIVQVIASQTAYLLMGAGMGVAQQPQMLPPPPQIAPLPSIELPSSPMPPSSAPQQETIFQAPINSTGSPGAISKRYLVYVNGDSPYLLQQVRTVEPGAFIQQYQGRRVIQAGAFSEEANAQRQVAVLNERGVMAEMTAFGSGPNLPQTSRYLVVVPGSREELPLLRNQAIRLGVRQDVIQEKDAPFGPHLEIGPFSEHREAKDVDRYLRSSGLDSRVYYSR